VFGNWFCRTFHETQAESRNHEHLDTVTPNTEQGGDMNALKTPILLALSATLLLATFVGASQTPESPEPPLSDSRLTVHTLVREDIFAGWLDKDMERMARGEKNIETLLQERPQAKADLLAWKAGATLSRAILAQEAKRGEEFKRKYQEALDLFAQARKIAPEGGGVNAITGGSYVLFADRLPKQYRAAAWKQAYDSYQILWKQQSAIIDRLPVHLRGEVLGGLVQSALRTGRTEEAAKHLDKMLIVMKDTPYEPVAKRLKENPKAGEKTSIACLSCHEDGRLAARLTVLNKKEP
jgi:hypothetical protein